MDATVRATEFYHTQTVQEGQGLGSEKRRLFNELVYENVLQLLRALSHGENGDLDVSVMQ